MAQAMLISCQYGIDHTLNEKEVCKLGSCFCKQNQVEGMVVNPTFIYFFHESFSKQLLTTYCLPKKVLCSTLVNHH